MMAWPYAALAVLAAGAVYGGDAAGAMSPLAQYAADGDAQIECRTGMVLVLKAADMTPACVGQSTGQVLIERGWAVEAPASMVAPAYSRGSGHAGYDGATAGRGSDAQAAKRAVSEALAMYDESGEPALARITASAADYDPSEPYVFVLELSEPPVVAAHGALPERVGKVSKSLTAADRPYAEIAKDLRSSEGTWVEYVFTNPATGMEQSKKSWLVMRGDYAFGSGYYVETDAQAAKRAVSEAISMYEESGASALEAITASADAYDSSKPYVFVLDSETRPSVLAHGALPERVGTSATPLLQADRPYAQILRDMGSSDGTWVEYVFENPATGMEQSKKSWLVMRDGYVFGSGYYTETDAQAVKRAVSEALAMYDESGEPALARITASAADYDPSEPYVFVLELSEPPVVAAHGALPERVGKVSKSLTAADRPYAEIAKDLRSSEGTWVEYVFTNPATGAEQSKKSWLVMRGDYVFGSGYYVGSSAWESAAMDAVSEAISTYEESGGSALEAITASAAGYDSSVPYVFVLDDSDVPTILAHGALPERVGTEAAPLLQADRPYAQILADMRSSEGTWAEYVFTNPATGLEQSKKSWLVMRDGYVFGSGYYTETDAQAVKRAVSEAVELYEAHGAAAIEAITGSAADRDPARPYVFVLDGSEEPRVVAHGAFPDRVGSVSTLLLNADRPYARILQDLRGSDGTWAEYVFLNPATDTEQLKRSWLSLRDGYVFGSGYYLAGSR